MKYSYDVSEVYSYIKKWEVHSNKQLNQDEIQDICINYENRDYKSELLMHFQRKNQNIEFKVKKLATDNNKIAFLARVFSDGQILGEGVGNSKKEAEKEACKKVLTSS